MSLYHLPYVFPLWILILLMHYGVVLHKGQKETSDFLLIVPPLQVMKTIVDYCLSLKVLTTSITSYDINVPDINRNDSNYLESKLSLVQIFQCYK